MRMEKLYPGGGTPLPQADFARRQRLDRATAKFAWLAIIAVTATFGPHLIGYLQ